MGKWRDHMDYYRPSKPSSIWSYCQICMDRTEHESVGGKLICKGKYHNKILISLNNRKRQHHEQLGATT